MHTCSEHPLAYFTSCAELILGQDWVPNACKSALMAGYLICSVWASKYKFKKKANIERV